MQIEQEIELLKRVKEKLELEKSILELRALIGIMQVSTKDAEEQG